MDRIVAALALCIHHSCMSYNYHALYYGTVAEKNVLE